MKSRFVAVWLVGGVLSLWASAEEVAPPKAPVKIKILKAPDASGKNAKAVIVTPDKEKRAKSKTPSVEASIPEPVKALGEPSSYPFPAGIHMAVSSTSEKAQEHVNQGLNHLHGGWEFQASRHFAAAMREDPDCLLAHWGMIMSLLSPSPETGAARNAVTERFLDLIDAGKGTELERGYCYGLIKYIEEGPAAAGNAFRKVAAEFPNDIQATIFAALFTRSGYDETGASTADQELAEKLLLDLAEKNPASTLPINALLTIRAEAPDLSSSLALARQLCQTAPDYAPYFHLLGHYEWRCGNHARAASAFGRASSFFENWMKTNKATLADCPEWIKSECYRVVALASKDDFDTAYAAARLVADIPFPKSRPSSPGARLLLWDAKTLPARLLLQRGIQAKAPEAMLSLPDPASIESTRSTSLAYWWIDGIRLVLEAQRLIDEGKLDESSQVLAVLTQHGEAMSRSQGAATNSGERSAWTRAFRGLEVLASELRGRLALAGPKERAGTAYNWFASAADRQTTTSLMLPPMILSPMANHLGEYYLANDKPQEAIDSYQRALVSFPNNVSTLTGLKTAYTRAAKPDEAAKIEKKIQELRSQ